ncbi:MULTISPECIES: hypothetical protein [Bacillaceae]|uniref:Uncharacterized protein n=1 Tax=Peribacillus huizhouensis TaxID=1501239 RepID=A0ABR6CSV6_9BACI|nr:MULTISPECIES: hypothetical protein [Bacillaceae]MBA9028117.1 hypothetical protein [Peribacillus huizhouensis]
MMEEEKKLDLDRKLDEVIKRLDQMEKHNQNQNHGRTFGHNVWVLVPIVAIVMWGLQRIL